MCLFILTNIINLKNKINVELSLSKKMYRSYFFITDKICNAALFRNPNN